MLPAIFFGHGNPMNSIENNICTKGWMDIMKNVKKPKNILIISAHWQTQKTRITNNDRLKTIHDSYDWAVKFNNEIKDAIFQSNHDKIINYHEIFGAKESVPTTEHFLPMIYILALKTAQNNVRFFNDYFDLASISMTSFIVE